MPELPDVETLKRYVDSTCLHRSIEDIDVDAPRMLRDVSAAKLRDVLKGAAFAKTARHGKFLFIETSKGPWLVLHFGMTGSLRYYKEPAKTPDHTRLLVHFSDGYRLAGVWRRRLGRICLTDGPAVFAEAQELGIDGLDPGLHPKVLGKTLGGRRGGMKSALMDQGFIAGIGNVYGDEMLFQAGIRPDAKARDLDDDQITRLHRAMGHVLRLATERQADPERLPDSWLLSRREEGATCPRCGAAIERTKTAGLTTYFCPRCQS